MASRLDEHLADIVAWRKEGRSFVAIASELASQGVTISGRGLSAWYWRRQSQRKARQEETAAFEDSSLPPATASITPFPSVEASPDRQGGGPFDDDWTMPARPRRSGLKVMQNHES